METIFTRFSTIIALIVCISGNAQRATNGLLALYTFREGSGSLVQDVGPSSSPLTLKIQNPGAVEWLAGGGLRIAQSTLIKSLEGTHAIAAACATSNEIALEVWVKPLNTSQDGPARILTSSFGSNTRNFVLGQTTSRYMARTRTTTTDATGTSNLLTNTNAVQTNLQHVVYTRNSSGQEFIYINGVQAAQGTRGGNLSAFLGNFELAIGNEIGSARPWLGDIFLAAVYSRALSAAEVMQNHNAGQLQPGISFTSTNCSATTCFVDGFGSTQRALWLPNVSFPGGTDYRVLNGNSHFETFPDGTAHLYGEEWNINAPGYGWNVDIWFSNKMNWAQWSALGRGWKGDPNIVGNLFQTWDFYIIDTTRVSTLTGLGAFAGSSLTVTHKPTNYYYGLQVGTAANDKNNLPGFSVWFYVNGTINGTTFSGEGDFNLEGECIQMPVMECLPDASTDCVQGIDPSFTGTPHVNCEGEYTLGYTDQILQAECPKIIQRTWLATSGNGSAECVQTISVFDTQAPVITPGTLVWSNCAPTLGPDFTITDDCEGNVTVQVTFTNSNSGGGTGGSGGSGGNGGSGGSSGGTTTEPCQAGVFRTQTQGGWGANPNGNNPGVYVANNFATAFPNGLTIGCNNTLKLTSAAAVRDFLPSGSTPSALPAGNMVDPGGTYTNVLAGQLVAATLSIGFDNASATYSASTIPLGSLVIASGTFQGMTMNQMLAIANQVIGGCATNYSFSEVNAALTSFNENFVDGSANQGYLLCPTSSNGTPISSTACTYEVTANITAIDLCGNTSTFTQTYTMEDTDAPVFNDVVVELDVQCGQVPPADTTIVSDCMSGVASVSVNETSFSGGCLPTIQRTYIAYDHCGNRSTFTQFIHVLDTIAPAFQNTPVDVNVTCNESYTRFTPQVTDNCSEVAVTMDSVVTVNNCTRTIVYTWIARDLCGNTAQVSQTIRLTDTSAPMASDFLGEVFAQCGNQPVASAPEFSDDCGSVVLTVQVDTIGAGCNLTVVKHFTATDNCGQTTEATQTIHFGDSEPPVFYNITADTLLACSASIPESAPIAIDECSNATVVYAQTVINEPGFCKALRRTWTATDACGNQAIAQQIVRFVDTEAPTYNDIQSVVNVSCGQTVPVPSITFTDNCDGVITPVFTTSQSQSGCTTTITRTWTATDACGNTAIAIQSIVSNDTQAPVITAPASLSINCAQVATLSISASDNCTAVPSITYADQINGNGCSYVLTRTWTATDGCGNASSFVQTVQVSDTQAPVFTFVPAAQTLVCTVAIPNTMATAIDNCSPASTVSFTDAETGTPCNRTITRTWRATDACGNSTLATTVYTIADNQPPMLQGVPANQTISCVNYVYPAVPTNITATDNCQTPPQVVFSEQNIPGTCPNQFRLVRKWTATDVCGNVAVGTQTIFIVDNAGPTFTGVPANVTVQCNNIPPVPTLTATDNCGGTVNITFNSTTQTGGCPIIIRTWTATDACGNATTAVQRITLVDTQPPVVSGLPPVGPVSCNNIPPVVYPTAIDNCDDNVDISYNEGMIGNGCQYTLMRTFIATDDCGNSTVVSQSIIVVDNVAPVYVNPQPAVTLNCTQLQAHVGPTVTDGCSQQITKSFTDEVVGSGCSYTILRTYRATDACGNSSMFVQTINVVDNVAPVISGVPLSTFVSCSNIPTPPTVTANDACSGPVPVTYTQTQIGSGCSFQLQRRWTAVDPCGNTAVRTQLIYVSDNQAPVLVGVPAAATISCSAPLPTAATVTATDNCSLNGAQPTVSMSQLTENLPCGYKLTRIWTAVDACGNTATASQIITVVDTNGPVLSAVPANVTVNCESIPNATSITAADDCSGAVNVAYNEQVNLGICPYTIVRTWSAVDACGNATTAQQTITVIDNTFPVLTGVPADVTVNCGTNVPVAPVTAADNCTATLPVVYVTSSTVNGCTTRERRQWTATDICGNTTQREQFITYVDNQAPVLTAELNDLQVQCTSEIPTDSTLAAVDCHGVNVSVQTISNGGDCANQSSYVKIFTLTDGCGNSTSLMQNIVVLNTSAPVITNVPADAHVDCNSIPAVPVVTATDACGNIVTPVFQETTTAAGTSNTCVLNTTQAIGPDVVIWLPNLPGSTAHYVFGNTPGLMTEDANGNVHVTGTVYNVSNGAQAWSIDMYLGNKRNWTQWSALGRSYKDDMGLAANTHQDWMYYELLPQSKLVGLGDFAGAQLDLVHAPANYYYGFQLGWAANNHNEAYGLSGWFSYTGTFNGQSISGVGDLITENQCCPEQTITRTWTVTDCSGNQTVQTQQIHVSPQFIPGNIAQAMHAGANTFEVSNSGGDLFALQYNLENSGRVQIELYDMYGSLIAQVYSGEITGGTTYRFTYPKDGLVQGFYIFRLVQGDIVLADRELNVSE